MDSIELTRVERRVRLRYEWARLFRAGLGFAPVLVVVAFAVGLGRRPSTAMLFGGGLLLAGVWALWRGQGLNRAVLPGVLTGSIPLVLALVANLMHGCSGGHCSTFCVPACTAGGVIAGLVVSLLLLRQGRGWSVWGVASGISLLTGAMGCACVGYSGIIGMAAGFVVGVSPQAVRRMFASS